MRRSLGIIAAAAIGAAMLPAIRGQGQPGPDADIVQIVGDVSAARIQRSIYVLTSFKTRHTLSDPAPSGDGIGGAAAWIGAEMGRIATASGGRLRVDVDQFVLAAKPPAVPQPVSISNFAAVLPGTQSGAAGRTIVVVAHYDSRASNMLDPASPAPGANFDASGVAVVLELARVMAQRDYPATIVFLAVAGEEQGLLGSTHWSERARAAGTDIEAVIDDEGVGNTHAPDGTVDRSAVRLFAGGIASPAIESFLRGAENDSPARELARSIREIAGEYAPAIGTRVIFRADSERGGGDHLPFAERGYAAVRLSSAVEDPRHERRDAKGDDGDLTDYIDFAYAADVARVNAAVLATLALAPPPPRGTKTESAFPETGVVVRWQPDSDPDVAGYRVLWRESTSTWWAHYVDLPKSATRASVRGVSRDEELFGVEAFDSLGHFSPASFAP